MKLIINKTAKSTLVQSLSLLSICIVLCWIAQDEFHWCIDRDHAWIFNI